MPSTRAATDRLPDLVLVPGGEFLMGSAEGDADERPPHPVEVDDFLMAARPVTNAEYAAFVRDTNQRPPAIYDLPLVVTAGGRERERVFRAAAKPYIWFDGEPPPDRLEHPVTLVRWEDAAAYCAWLSSTTGRPVRLPTEAEWEKAARGGMAGQKYPWGDRLDPDQVNFLTDPSQKAKAGTTRCGSFPPNGFGLYDMAGNVWEWVHDWYAPDYYAHSPAHNPAGPSKGQLRVLRGGSWLSADVRMLSCAYRHKVPPDTYSYAIGFRVAAGTK